MKIIFITVIFFLIFTISINAVEINILNSLESVCRENEFEVGFNIFDDLHPLSIYSYKARIGSNSASLNQGQTFNSLTNNWLDDTSSWTSFPTINLNENGIATSSVKLKTKKSAAIGNNLLIIRVNKDSKNYDSPSKNILIVEPSTSPTPTEMPTLTITEIPIPTIETLATSTPTPTLTEIVFNNIYLSEVMVNPESGENEWVEIYNNNDFAATLNNWYVDDIENGGSTPKVFNLEISAKGYGIFDLNTSVFNNSGDSVRLLDLNKTEKDSFEYSSSEQGKTWGRSSLDDDNFCLQESSKGKENTICINSTSIIISPTISTAPTSLSMINNKIEPTVSSINKLPNNVKPIKTQQNYPGETQGEVLGVITAKKEDLNQKAMINFFSFNSLVYSLLTILSLSFKIKFRL